MVALRVTWDTNVAPSIQHTHVYFDGVEPSYRSAPTGPISLSAGSGTGTMRIGNFVAASQGNAFRVIDELQIHDQVLPP